MKLFKRKKKISIKEAIDLTGFPIVTLKSNGKPFNFLLDTGSNCSVLDVKCPKKLEGVFTGDFTTLSGLDGIEREVKFFRAQLSYEDRGLTEDFQVTDLSGPFESVKKEFGVTLHGILGNSFFTKYNSVINFEKLNFYV